MADVMRDERGQLMLVAALAIAVLLVGLALTLNTAIYTENLATRTTDTHLSDANAYGEALEEGTGGLLDAVNREGGTYGELETKFDSSYENWSSATATLGAARGRVTNTTRVDETRGTRIAQSNASLDFTGGSDDWTVSTNEHVRGIRFNVSRNSLETGSDPFELVLDDGSDTVTTELSRNATHVIVTVDAPSGVSTCETPVGAGEYVTIDVTDGMLGRQPCSALDAIHDDLDGTLTVEFEEGSKAVGTYELYTDDLYTAFDEAWDGLFGPDTGPTSEPALYAVDVSYVFQSGETRVEREVRIAPGEIA
ncbi:hypothetical protein [Haloferax sp. DFSO60]|uniref:DUF7261 family protein n=1 Tax=Haloferax sp. DFSO60 TaxID=3388652 RepID=UPI0039797BAA